MVLSIDYVIALPDVIRPIARTLAPMPNLFIFMIFALAMVSDSGTHTQSNPNDRKYMYLVIYFLRN
jgi:hypothetical protein